MGAEEYELLVSTLDKLPILNEKLSLEREKYDKANQRIFSLKEQIDGLENELKTTNQIKDSIHREIAKFQPFEDLIEKKGDFMYTLTTDLKEQIEKNKILQQENKKLLDSINYLINKQESFKLEYLEVLDQMMQKEDTMNMEKKDTIYE